MRRVYFFPLLLSILSLLYTAKNRYRIYCCCCVSLSTAMISGSVVVPFQKGPCGEGKAVLGFLLPLVEVVVWMLSFFSLFVLMIKKRKMSKIKFCFVLHFFIDQLNHRIISKHVFTSSTIACL